MNWKCPSCDQWFADEGYKYRHVGSKACAKATAEKAKREAAQRGGK